MPCTLSVCVCVCVCLCVCVCVCVCVCIYMCVCVCVCVYIYIYAETLEEMEATCGTVNIRNNTEKIIVPYYVMRNISSKKIYLCRLTNIAENSVPCMRE
jgi:hypothetical protein